MEHRRHTKVAPRLAKKKDLRHEGPSTDQGSQQPPQAPSPPPTRRSGGGGGGAFTIQRRLLYLVVCLTLFMGVFFGVVLHTFFLTASPTMVVTMGTPLDRGAMGSGGRGIASGSDGGGDSIKGGGGSPGGNNKPSSSSASPSPNRVLEAPLIVIAPGSHSGDGKTTLTIKRQAGTQAGDDAASAGTSSKAGGISPSAGRVLLTKRILEQWGPALLQFCEQYYRYNNSSSTSSSSASSHGSIRAEVRGDRTLIWITAPPNSTTTSRDGALRASSSSVVWFVVRDVSEPVAKGMIQRLEQQALSSPLADPFSATVADLCGPPSSVSSPSLTSSPSALSPLLLPMHVIDAAHADALAEHRRYYYAYLQTSSPSPAEGMSASGASPSLSMVPNPLMPPSNDEYLQVRPGGFAHPQPLAYCRNLRSSSSSGSSSANTRSGSGSRRDIVLSTPNAEAATAVSGSSTTSPSPTSGPSATSSAASSPFTVLVPLLQLSMRRHAYFAPMLALQHATTATSTSSVGTINSALLGEAARVDEEGNIVPTNITAATAPYLFLEEFLFGGVALARHYHKSSTPQDKDNASPSPSPSFMPPLTTLVGGDPPQTFSIGAGRIPKGFLVLPGESEDAVVSHLLTGRPTQASPAVSSTAAAAAYPPAYQPLHRRGYQPTFITQNVNATPLPTLAEVRREQLLLVRAVTALEDDAMMTALTVSYLLRQQVALIDATMKKGGSGGTIASSSALEFTHEARQAVLELSAALATTTSKHSSSSSTEGPKHLSLEAVAKALGAVRLATRVLLLREKAAVLAAAAAAATTPPPPPPPETVPTASTFWRIVHRVQLHTLPLLRLYRDETLLNNETVLKHCNLDEHDRPNMALGSGAGRSHRVHRLEQLVNVRHTPKAKVLDYCDMISADASQRLLGLSVTSSLDLEVFATFDVRRHLDGVFRASAVASSVTTGSSEQSSQCAHFLPTTASGGTSLWEQLTPEFLHALLLKPQQHQENEQQVIKRGLAGLVPCRLRHVGQSLRRYHRQALRTASTAAMVNAATSIGAANIQKEMKELGLIKNVRDHSSSSSRVQTSSLRLGAGQNPTKNKMSNTLSSDRSSLRSPLPPLVVDDAFVPLLPLAAWEQQRWELMHAPVAASALLSLDRSYRQHSEAYRRNPFVKQWKGAALANLRMAKKGGITSVPRTVVASAADPAAVASATAPAGPQMAPLGLDHEDRRSLAHLRFLRFGIVDLDELAAASAIVAGNLLEASSSASSHTTTTAVQLQMEQRLWEKREQPLLSDNALSALADSLTYYAQLHHHSSSIATTCAAAATGAVKDEASLHRLWHECRAHPIHHEGLFDGPLEVVLLHRLPLEQYVPVTIPSGNHAQDQAKQQTGLSRLPLLPESSANNVCSTKKKNGTYSSAKMAASMGRIRIDPTVPPPPPPPKDKPVSPSLGLITDHILNTFRFTAATSGTGASSGAATTDTTSSSAGLATNDIVVFESGLPADLRKQIRFTAHHVERGAVVSELAQVVKDAAATAKTTATGTQSATTSTADHQQNPSEALLKQGERLVADLERDVAWTTIEDLGRQLTQAIHRAAPWAALEPRRPAYVAIVPLTTGSLFVPRNAHLYLSSAEVYTSSAVVGRPLLWTADRRVPEIAACVASNGPKCARAASSSLLSSNYTSSESKTANPTFRKSGLSSVNGATFLDAVRDAFPFLMINDLAWQSVSHYEHQLPYLRDAMPRERFPHISNSGDGESSSFCGLPSKVEGGDVIGNMEEGRTNCHGSLFPKQLVEALIAAAAAAAKAKTASGTTLHSGGHAHLSNLLGASSSSSAAGLLRRTPSLLPASCSATLPVDVGVSTEGDNGRVTTTTASITRRRRTFSARWLHPFVQFALSAGYSGGAISVRAADQLRGELLLTVDRSTSTPCQGARGTGTMKDIEGGRGKVPYISPLWFGAFPQPLSALGSDTTDDTIEVETDSHRIGSDGSAASGDGGVRAPEHLRQALSGSPVF